MSKKLPKITAILNVGGTFPLGGTRCDDKRKIYGWCNLSMNGNELDKFLKCSNTIKIVITRTEHVGIKCKDCGEYIYPESHLQQAASTHGNPSKDAKGKSRKALGGRDEVSLCSPPSANSAPEIVCKHCGKHKLEHVADIWCNMDYPYSKRYEETKPEPVKIVKCRGCNKGMKSLSGYVDYDNRATIDGEFAQYHGECWKKRETKRGKKEE
jgi:ribosomal protein L32